MSATSVEGGPQKCTFEEKLLEKNWKNIGEYKLNENFTGPKKNNTINALLAITIVR